MGKRRQTVHIKVHQRWRAPQAARSLMSRVNPATTAKSQHEALPGDHRHSCGSSQFTPLASLGDANGQARMTII
eukprot:6180392-Pleurochrysis_carterae.AAC.2